MRFRAPIRRASAISPFSVKQVREIGAGRFVNRCRLELLP
jgi:hypothetical protein